MILLNYIGIICIFKYIFVFGQSMQEQNDNDLHDETLVITSLVLSILAGVGVVMLTVYILCHLYNTRKKSIPDFPFDLTDSIPQHASLTEKCSHFSELHVEGTHLSTVPLEPPNICMGVAVLRQVTLNMLQEAIYNLYKVTVKMNHPTHIFKSEDVFDVVSTVPAESVEDLIRERLKVIFGNNQSKFNLFLRILEEIVTASTVRELVQATLRVCRVAKGIVREWKVEKKAFIGTIPEDGPGYISFTIEDNVDKMKITWDEQTFSHEFLYTISLILQALRDEGRHPTPTEHLAVHLAYHCIDNGKQLTLKPYRSLGTPGFRTHTQTYISITDPGIGHVLGTTQSNDWMLGTIVKVSPTPETGPYRTPNLLDFSKVRLHVGASAPTTFAISCQVKDPNSSTETFGNLIEMTAAITSTVFYQGTAKCSVSMENLTTCQAVRYMKELLVQTHRDHYMQIMSASWKLHNPLTDDYEILIPQTLTDKMEIARRAIEITCVGGFGAISLISNHTNQLKFEEALAIIHEAHSKGLNVFFSDGKIVEDIYQAVYTGVDGMEMGDSEVIKLLDIHNGQHGPFMEENIPIILRDRDSAASTIYGQGALLLARLDTMFYEGSLSSTGNTIRYQLFTALSIQELGIIENIMSQLQNIMAMECECGLYVVGSARRLVNSPAPLLKEVADSGYEWILFITRLRTLVIKHDVKSIIQEYEDEPWLGFRAKYHKLREQGEPDGCSSTQM